MITEQSLTKSWEKIGRYEPVSSHLTFDKNGLTLGAGTVIVPSGRDEWGRPVLKIDGNEEHILALLSVAHDQPVMPRILDNLRSASRCWCKGEITLAYIHIAFSGLQALEDEEAPRRLFMAKRLLDHGMDEAEMLKGLNLLPQCFTPWSWQQLVKEFNPDQPRDDHGRWTSEGGTGNLSALTPEQINRLQTTQLSELSTTQIGAITTSDQSDKKQDISVSHQPGGEWVISGYQNQTAIAGTGKYYGQCVQLIHALAPDTPLVGAWRADQQVQGYGDPPLQPGTVIATMDENGEYPKGNEPKHAAVFVKYEMRGNTPGMVIYDQYVRKDGTVKAPGTRWVGFTGNKTHPQNDAGAYSSIKSK